MHMLQGSLLLQGNDLLLPPSLSSGLVALCELTLKPELLQCPCSLLERQFSGGNESMSLTGHDRLWLVCQVRRNQKELGVAIWGQMCLARYLFSVAGLTVVGFSSMP